MDPQNLFKKEQANPKSGKTYRQLIITCADRLIDQPLIYGIKNDKKFIFKKGNARQRYKWISEGAVDFGFISSIDFALLKGGWKVIPNLCISSSSSASTALFFNEGLTEFAKIAIPKGVTTESVVLKILMKELYNSDPQFIEVKGINTNLLNEYDALLLTGQAAVLESQKSTSFLNISEEWFELTGLPLVYGFWVASENTTNNADCRKISKSFKSGITQIKKISQDFDADNNDIIMDHYLQSLNFNMGENEIESLEELYKYAFFYGFTDYIPEFNFAERVL